MRKLAALFIGAALLIAQAPPVRADETPSAAPPAAAQPAAEAPRMLGLTAGHWVAIGVGALTGSVVVYSIGQIPTTFAALAGAIAGSWYWQTHALPAARPNTVRDEAVAEGAAVR